MGLFRRRQPLSRTRRVLRALVWTTLIVVAWARWNMPHDPMSRFGGQGFRGGRAPWGPRGREREQTPEFKPVAAIPADLYRVHIEIGAKDAETLSQYHWGWPGRGGGGNGERPEVRITVREGDRVYTNVAMHLKGSAGSFQGLEHKPAMTLHFSKYAEGQKFHGYTKLSLNNSVQDPTYLSEAICREMFVAAGVPAPKVEHATVVLNGRELGMYVLSEGWGKPFLRRYFEDVGGNLYDGGFVRDLDADLEVNSGDDKESRADLDRLIRAARASSGAQRWERLNEVLDVDRFLTFAALEVMTCHWDGYCLNRNNYRVFHDRKTGKMVFLPHGMDQTFGTGRSHPRETIRPQMSGLVARSVLGTPEGRARYLERIASLSAQVFVEEKLTNRLWELARKLQPTLAALSPDAAAWHRTMVQDYADRIGERARSIVEQLAAPDDGPVVLAFDASGTARLTGWRGRITDQESGPVRFERETMGDVPSLRITTQASGGRGSWRSQVTLESGRYRFEARARTEGVKGNGGVCLRISGIQMPLRALDDGVWTDLRFEFELGDEVAEVQLVAELRSAGGSAWFDTNSLRLVRVP